MNDKHFNKYRKHLSDEVIKLSGFISVFRTLHERRNDRLDAMNMAPAFFRSVLNSLYSSIVLWSYKLYDENSERGFCNLLNFVEGNLGMFSKTSFKERSGTDENHFLFRNNSWKPLTIDEIESHRQMIRSNHAIANIKIQRDKFHAHFDSKYFFDRDKLDIDAPVTWNDLDSIKDLSKKLLSRYSKAFDGTGIAITPVNIEDINGILDIVKNYRDALFSDFDETKNGS